MKESPGPPTASLSTSIPVSFDMYPKTMFNFVSDCLSH